MTQQIINTGTADKGNGDPLRTAFTKVNANFTELYNQVAASVVVNSTAPGTPTEGDLWWDPVSGRMYLYYGTSWVDASPVDGVGISSTNELVNGAHTVSLGSDGNLSIPDRITFSDDTWQSTAFIGHAYSLRNNPTGSLYVTLDDSGTINTPLLLPLTFTAVLDSAHKTGAALTLTDTPWEFTVQFQVNPDGSVETMMNSIFPNLVNPGYTTADQFSFTEADHGIPGYTFELELDNLVLAGPAGWTASPVVSIPPEYPSTVKSLGAIKLTANDQNLVFGTDGTLTLPNTLYVYTGLDGAIVGTNGVVIKAKHANPLGLEWSLDGEENIFINDPQLNTDTVSVQFGLNGVNIEVNNLTNGGSWTFSPDQALRFPDGLKIADSVISRRLEQLGEGTVDAIGSKLTLTDNNIAMEAYADPDGLNNIQYSRVTVGGGSVVLKSATEIVSGESYGQLSLSSGLEFSFSDGVVTNTFGVDPAGLVILNNSTYFEPQTSDTNFVNPTGKIRINTGEGIQDLENTYTGALAYLDAVFAEETLTSGYPWGITLPVSYATYTELLQLTPDTFPSQTFITVTAKAASDAYTDWQAALTAAGVDINVGPESWQFGSDGRLTVPGAIFRDGGLYMNSSGSTTAASVFVNGFAGDVILRTADNANNVSHDLVFDVNGNLGLPLGGAVNATNLNVDYINYQTNTSIQVGQPGGGRFNVAMDRFQVLAVAPTSSVGSEGDVVGCVAFDASYIYYCTGLYNGVANIWKRVLWSGDTW